VIEPLDLTIESDRLRLVAVSDAYAADIFREFTAEIAEFMGPRPPTVLEETLSYIRDSRGRMARNQEFNATVLLKETDEFLGNAGLHSIDSRTPELGVWIKKPAQGQRYGREAISALIGWAFENLIVEYLKYPVDRRNVASRTIPDSLNGTVAAEYDWTNLSGRVLNLLEYHVYPPKTAT
jgi:RimJ/RimL family protein N-acetyltransferase